jgi:hypothetical protein
MKHTSILPSVLLFLFIFSANIFSQDEPEKYKEEYKSPWESQGDSQCDCHCEYCRNNHHEHGEYNYSIKAISSRDFNDLTNVVAARSFESSKMSVIKAAMQENYFSTEQVKTLLSMFAFDSNRLELAKYAYAKTIDNNRYYKIYDVFSFESSISDLEDFIRNQ